MNAAKPGVSDVVSRLLCIPQVLKNIEARDAAGRTALAWACGSGSVDCARDLLIYWKADPSMGDEANRTPLHFAACNGHIEVVKLLLLSGRVDLDAKNKYGRTAVAEAARNGHKEVVKLLTMPSRSFRFASSLSLT
jgi:ankyrin repeat protein